MIFRKKKRAKMSTVWHYKRYNVKERPPICSTRQYANQAGMWGTMHGLQVRGYLILDVRCLILDIKQPDWCRNYFYGYWLLDPWYSMELEKLVNCFRILDTGRIDLPSLSPVTDYWKMITIYRCASWGERGKGIKDLKNFKVQMVVLNFLLALYII